MKNFGISNSHLITQETEAQKDWISHPNAAPGRQCQLPTQYSFLFLHPRSPFNYINSCYVQRGS